MPTDLHERLADYRRPLDDAIASDLANRPAASGRQHLNRDRALVGVSAVLLVAAGIGALAWTGTNRTMAPSNTLVLDQPATSTSDSLRPMLPERTTSPATVVPPPPETSPPSGSPTERIALGDSIMLGAARQLVDSGFAVDAVESQSFADGLDTIRRLRTNGRLGDVVVLQLGANGPISGADMTQMMEALSGVPQVLLVTNAMPRSWTADNNDLMSDSAAAHSNVSLLDWGGLGEACPGDCFYNDGYHLRPDGQTYYTDLIRAALEDN